MNKGVICIFKGHVTIVTYLEWKSLSFIALRENIPNILKKSNL
jgi:hypothetical protein